jgi:hypothetical protein
MEILIAADLQMSQEECREFPHIAISMALEYLDATL